MGKKIKIGITIGDINGIGPEVIIKALSTPKVMDYFIPIIYGSSKALAYHKNIVNDANFTFVSTKDTHNAAYNKVNVINAWDDDVNINLGVASEVSGKCAFKALQYMSLAIPVVLSPVGVNLDLVEHEINGFHANSVEQWHQFLKQLIESDTLRTSIGTAGQQTIQERFSTAAIWPSYQALTP